LFTDEFRTPLAAAVVARAVWALAGQTQAGLFHLGGAERLSRWAIGQLLAERWPELRPRIEPGSLRDYPGPPRPPDVSLDCSRLQTVLPFPLPRFGDWLRAQPSTAF
jgi:dTDP-4-dehydrorhamnose reductase